MHRRRIGKYFSMDVPGSGAEARDGVRRATFSRGSDNAPDDIFCAECTQTGECVVATGYCIECQDFLCNFCIRHHRRSKASMDHIIREGGTMPKYNPHTYVEFCTAHPGTLLELYCPTDGAVGCSICFKQSHKKCETNSEFISDVCKDGNSAEEEIQRLQKEVRQKVSENRDLIKSYFLVNQNCSEKSNKDIDEYKATVEERLRLEISKMSADSETIKEINELKLNDLLKSLTKIEKDNAMSLTKFNFQQIAKEEKMRRFIAVKKTLRHMKESQQQLDQMRLGIRIQKYKVNAGPALKHETGKLIVWSGDVGHTEDITVTSSYDNIQCKVTGVVRIPPSAIVIVDNRNKCLKQIEVDKLTLVQRKSLADHPWGITTIPGSRVAVTLPDLKQIQFFTTNGTLTPCGTCSVSGRCLGIACTEDRLIVSYWKPGKIQIMDLRGQVFNTFTTDSAGQQLFNAPRYLSLSPDHSAIYVSDKDRNTITCLGTDGTVTWTYKAEDLKSPMGVDIVADCSLYVCSMHMSSLHVLSLAGVRLETIHVEQYDVPYPLAIRYGEEGALYMSCSSTNPKNCNFVRRLTFE